MSDLKTYSVETIEQMPVSRVVVIIDGGVYDVTEFLDTHPGGREILLKFNRRDASKAFKATNHSLTAVEMLHQYRIGVLEGLEEEHKKRIEELTSTRETLTSKLKRKLITHEDKFHIHKILGSLALTHLGFRTLVFLVGVAIFAVTGNNTVVEWNYQLTPAWLLLGFALIHAVLSLSSLQFVVPKKSNQSKPMIHSLFRAHSINFAVRACICMAIFVLLADNPPLRNLALSIVVFITFVLADVITVKLTDKDDNYRTTASMPYWYGVSVDRQRTHKFLYGYGQFLASYVCLFGGYIGALYTLAPIQGAAFGMTLVRKNIISARTYHNVYLVSLFLPVPFALYYYPQAVSSGLIFVLFLFCARLLGVNKYLLWTPPLILFNWLLVPDEHRVLFLNVLTILWLVAISINALFIVLLRRKRIDRNNRVISRKQITNDSFELVVRTRLPMKPLPGQHVLIRMHDRLERKYTPIWYEYIEETKQTLLCLRIKEYKFGSKQTVSSYLANCPIGTIIDLHGPVGEKYYSQDTRLLIDNINNKTFDSASKDIFLLSAGSGITPIYQIAKNICAQGNQVNLITCDKSPDTLMLEPELSSLKENFPKLLKWTSVFSSTKAKFDNADEVINERLDPEKLDTLLPKQKKDDTVIIMCGPDGWQKMIRSALSKRSDNLQLLSW